MSKKLFLLVLFLSITLRLYCQRAVLMGLQTDLGSPMNTFLMNKKLLKSHPLSYDFQGALSIQYRLWDRIGFEIGVSQSIHKWRIKDKDFESRHPGFVVDLRNKTYFYGGFANLQFLQPLSTKIKFYLIGGYALNSVGAKSISQRRTFVMDNENVTSTTAYQPKNASVSAGLGLQFEGRVSVFSIGLKANLGRSNLLKGSYEVEKDGQIIKRDNFFSKGSYLGLSARYSIKVYQRDKKVRGVKPTNPVIANKPSDSQINSTLIEGRKINVMNSIVVASKKVTIKLWDHQTVDGDKVSLNLNGRWILQNYTLEKKQHIFEVELNQGKNIFVLHALNLGKIHPNTAALIIHDGTKEHRVVLESTLKTSGTIEVIYNQPTNK